MKEYYKYLDRAYGTRKPCVRAYVAIYNEQHHANLVLPDDDTWDRAVAMRVRLTEFFEQVVRPQTGDMVVLSKRDVSFHVGYLIVYNNIDYLLHAYKTAPVRLEKLSYLLSEIQDFRLVGFFRVKK